MRRSANILVASLLLVSMVSGCGIFGKKKTDAQMADATSESYVQPTYEDQVDEYDPYHADTSTAVAEPTYSTRTTVSAAPRYHTVAKGDTLYKLARAYYGNQARWKDVYEANSSEISDPNMIRVGQRLVIP